MNLALFDFDGTISVSDTYTPFIKDLPQPASRFWRKLSLLPFRFLYRRQWISTSRARQIATYMLLSGLDEQHVRAEGLKHAQHYLPETIRAIAQQRIDWHRRQGDTIVIVSASLDVYLKPWCEQHGYELLCNELAAKHGVLTGGYVQRDCCGPEKVARVMQRYQLDQFDKVYAYGDTPEDFPMLELADVAVYQWREWNGATVSA